MSHPYRSQVFIFQHDNGDVGGLFFAAPVVLLVVREDWDPQILHCILHTSGYMSTTTKKKKMMMMKSMCIGSDTHTNINI